MPSSITLPDDQIVTVPLVFSDPVGVVHAPPSGGSASSSDAAIVTATVSADDTSVVITSVADGSATVTYTNGSLTDTVDVTVAAPTPTSVAFDTGHAVFGPKPAP